MTCEVETLPQLEQLLTSGQPLAGLRLQSLDLSGPAGAALASSPQPLSGLVVLGGVIPEQLAATLMRRGALVFPPDPQAPVNPYRSVLYTAQELYSAPDRARNDVDSHSSQEIGDYRASLDFTAYEWFLEKHLAFDAYATALRALHDDSIRDALHEVLEHRRTVGIMGGHDLARNSIEFAAIAKAALRLADDGYVVLTGGGPGAMEAANLGARAGHLTHLQAALTILATTPEVGNDVQAWAATGFAALHELPCRTGDSVSREIRSVGIPTWFYGHEPPNVFGDRVAKYFSNALREDDLLAAAHDAVIVLPGAAGTVQEVFQCATPLYYAAEDVDLPHLILVGTEQWTQKIPVWPALTALLHGRRPEKYLHLVGSIDEALAIVKAPKARWE